MSRYKEPHQALKADQRKRKSSHPYAAIDHRVIDSPAFQDLRHSSVRVLLIIARQLNQYSNNGHLQATWSYCHPRGIGSETTLSDAIKDLISHGLIYRTHSWGSHKQWAKYAVTWLPIRNSVGLYLHGWRMDAWRDWIPSPKTRPRKLGGGSPSSRSSWADFAPETVTSCPPKNEGYELVPSTNPDLNRTGSV
jgi:hypothetical protein